jgi:TRAP-type C4-dicarboxylate transport system substrate-binding protein
MFLKGKEDSMKRSLNNLFVLVIAMGAVMFCPFFSADVNAAPKILKLSHPHPSGDARDLWAKKFVELVEKKTDGTINIKVYGAASLFKPRAQTDAMRKGALDFSVLPHIYIAGKIPEYAITSMPCLIRKTAQGASWGDRKIGKELDKIALQNGFRNLSWGCLLGSAGSKKGPIIVPKDVTGLRMRGAGSAMERMLKQGGAAITSMPSTEVYFALQTGNLDGLTTTYGSFVSFRLHEVLKNLTVSKDYSIFNVTFGIFIGNKTWNRLTGSERNALVEAGKESEPYFLKLGEEGIDKCDKIFQEKGVKVDKLTEADFRKWKELAKKSAWKYFSENVEGGENLLKLALEVE